MPNENKEAVNPEDELAKMEAELAASVEEQNDQTDPEEQTPEEESPSSEEKPVKEDSQAGQANGEQEKLSDDELVSKLSEKAQRRFQEIANENKKLKTKLTQLEQTEQVADEVPEVKPPKFDYEKETGLRWDQTPELTRFEYEQHVAELAKRAAQQALEEGKKKETFKQINERLLSDIDKMRKKYPVLESDEEFSKKIAGWYRPQFEEARAKGRYFKFDAFVDDIMSLKQQGKEEGKQEVKSKVSKQAAEQAIPASTGEQPKQISKVDLVKQAKSIDDLEALEANL